MKKRKWIFDIMVGEETAIPTVQDLLSEAKVHRKNGQYEDAIICLRRADTYLPAALELADLYLNTPSNILGIDLSKRLLMAEQILLAVDNNLDVESSKACMLLSTLYKTAGKPLSAFGYLLRAKRYGWAVSQSDLKEIKGCLNRMDVLSISVQDPHGAYISGYEASMLEGSEPYRWATWLLQETVELGSTRYAGVAALTLAELLQAHAEDTPGNYVVAEKYRSIAAKLGFPEYLLLP